MQNIPKTGAKKNQRKVVMRRLVRIIDYLYTGQQVTVRELAQEFGVTERSVQGYIKEDLEAFGIVYNDDHTLRFSRPVHLKHSPLYEDERRFLSVSMAQIEDIDEEHRQLSEVIAKKIALESIETPYYIKPENFEPIGKSKKIAQELERAIKNRLKIELLFESKALTLFPYKIASFEGIWYLLADGLEDDSLRNYMLSHIEDIYVTAETFIPIPDLEEKLDDMESQWYVEGHSFEVVVKVYPEIADFFRLKRHLHSQEILERYDDGSLKVSFDVTHDEDIDNLIKSWLPHIEVLSPERFRDRITRELTEYLARIG